ncbi:MAG: hypothetical protein ABID61_05085 [Candidatus Micrarchaeota archaeon]
MKRAFLVLLILSMVVSAAFDQTYAQQMHRNGESSIEKTMDVAIFAGQLSDDAFIKMDNYCRSTTDVVCSIDVDKKIVKITESFSPGAYYSFTGDYGLPDTTYTLVVSKIPVDMFAKKFEKILVATDEATPSGDSGIVIDLRDKVKNAESAALLKTFFAKITYVVEMPSEIEIAYAGNVTAIVNGSTATFDFVAILEDSEPMVIVSKETNYGYIVAIVGVVALIVLAYAFIASSRPRQTKESKRRNKK